MNQLEVLAPAVKQRRSLAKGRIRLAVSLAALCCATLYVALNSDLKSIAGAATALPWTTTATVLGLFIIATCLASLRLWFIARDMGAPIKFADANVAVSVGSLMGALFFQVVGQIVGRSSILARRGTPVAAVLIMSAYERAAAELVCLALAGAGAWVLFGELTFDVQNGGGALLKILAAALTAVCAGAYLGWGRYAVSRLPELWRGGYFRGGGRTIAITAVIQSCSVAAYVVAAHALAPNLDVLKIAAAASIVMLAASLPFSFAGWGIRELSSIFALGAIGMPNEQALVVGLLVGTASLVALVIAPLLTFGMRRAPKVQSETRPFHFAQPSNFTTPLIWALAMAAATLIFFQIHVPSTHETTLNVNVADPFALTGAAFFVFGAIRARSWPSWRIQGLNGHLLLMTAAMTVALLIGWASVGWTAWAFTSKYLGWFVLLAYAATGALFVSTSGRLGYQVLLRTYVAAGVAIAIIEIVLVELSQVGVALDPSLAPAQASGLAANPNAFAFQMAMVVCAAAVLLRSPKYAVPSIAIALVATWLSGSRAGLGADAIVVAAAALLLPKQRGALLGAVLLAVTVVSALALFAQHPQGPPARVLVSSDQDRWKTITGGLALFWQHPVFGAGLGTFAENWKVEHPTLLIIHSTPVWLLAEFGLIGFVVFAMPFGRILLRALRAAIKGEKAATLVLLSCLAFATMALVHEMLYQRSFWLILGASLAPWSRAGRLAHALGCGQPRRLPESIVGSKVRAEV